MKKQEIRKKDEVNMRAEKRREMRKSLLKKYDGLTQEKRENGGGGGRSGLSG